MTIDSVIVDSDTLRAVGLRYLLQDRYALDPVVTSDPTELDGIDATTLFFVTAEAFASRPYFYVPRRERVVLIGHFDVSPLPAIDPSWAEEVMCGHLDEIAARLCGNTPALHVALSDREREVLRLIAMGRINKEIAADLGISFNTVLTHRRNIMEKLGVRSVPGLSMYAVMNGLVSQHEIQSK